MKLTILLLAIHNAIIFKLKELLSVEESSTLDEYLRDKEQRIDELNQFVVRLLMKHRDDIQSYLDEAHNEAIETITAHIENEWGADNEADYTSSETKRKSIEAINKFLIGALVTNSKMESVVVRKFNEMLDVIKEKLKDDTDDLSEVGMIVSNELEKGLGSRYSDKNNREWRYTATLTAIMGHLYNDTFNYVLNNELIRRRIELVKVWHFKNPRHACAKLQASGIICIVHRSEASDEAQRYPNIYDAEHEYGEPQGHHGINCRHAWHSLDASELQINIYSTIDGIRRKVNQYNRRLIKKLQS